MNTSFLFDSPACFTTQSPARAISVKAFCASAFTDWLNDQDAPTLKQVNLAGFSAKAAEILMIYSADGNVKEILAGFNETPPGIYDLASLPSFLKTNFSAEQLEDSAFTLEIFGDFCYGGAYLAWALGCYEFTAYKKADKPTPRLLIPEGIELTRTQPMVQAITLLRNMVNMPANDLGPAQIESIVGQLAATHSKTKVKVVKGSALEKGFPLVHAVGQAAVKERAPRLIDLSWSKHKDAPLVALVGKGVCFDTGGLDLKPSQYMKLMKKDMGGAAHVLALAHLIMSLDLPINLRVIIPAVENAVGGNAFRPGDVFTSRSGLCVENTDTDAEGRLILADALAYAAEQSPELIIDFATLTGSARAALGMDIPAVFTNDETLEEPLRVLSQKAQDPLWPMPLHQDYRALLKSTIADLVNHSDSPGDLMYSALFLEHFIGSDNPPKWVHVDCFAWESQGRPGRPKGGRDTGLRAMLAVLEELYRV